MQLAITLFLLAISTLAVIAILLIAEDLLNLVINLLTNKTVQKETVIKIIDSYYFKRIYGIIVVYLLSTLGMLFINKIAFAVSISLDMIIIIVYVTHMFHSLSRIKSKSRLSDSK